MNMKLLENSAESKMFKIGLESNPNSKMLKSHMFFFIWQLIIYAKSSYTIAKS